MKILILGGTMFVGRHLTEEALARGHEVTLFHRGQHGGDLFPQVETLNGDRDGGLDVLKNRSWDVVLDTCGYVPRIVRQSAALLSQAVNRYVFISSISIYRDFAVQGIDEAYPGATMPDESVEEVNGETYGPLKVLCERVVEEACPGRALIVRPGLIVGPHDKTGRFTYWPRRVAEGGDVLAPGRPDKRVQFIDARDLAGWTVRLIERAETGTFNAVSGDTTWTMGRVLDTCRAVSGRDARFVWASDDFLLAQGLAPWTDLPLWLPDSPEWIGADSISAARAVAAGLTFRSLTQTVSDTLAWDQALPTEARAVTLKAGITRERERELLGKLSENFTAP